MLFLNIGVCGMKKPKYGSLIRDWFEIKYFKKDSDWFISVFHKSTGKNILMGYQSANEKDLLGLYRYLTRLMLHQDYPMVSIHASHINEIIDNTGLPILSMQLIFKCEGDTNNDYDYLTKFDGVAV